MHRLQLDLGTDALQEVSYRDQSAHLVVVGCEDTLALAETVYTLELGRCWIQIEAIEGDAVFCRLRVRAPDQP